MFSEFAFFFDNYIILNLSRTLFEATAKIGNDVSINNVWFGIGINFDREMVN